MSGTYSYDEAEAILKAEDWDDDEVIEAYLGQVKVFEGLDPAASGCISEAGLDSIRRSLADWQASDGTREEKLSAIVGTREWAESQGQDVTEVLYGDPDSQGAYLTRTYEWLSESYTLDREAGGDWDAAFDAEALASDAWTPLAATTSTSCTAATP